MASQKKNDIEVQSFALGIKKTVNKKTKKTTIQFKAQPKGLHVLEAITIIEAWIKKVKERIQEPVVKSLRFK